jgi:hypothetical protein
MNTDSGYRRLFAMLSLGLFVAGLLLPFGIAATGQPQLAIGFGVVSEILALLFGLLGLPYAPARVAVICNTVLVAGAGIVAAVQWQQYMFRETEAVAWLRVKQLDTETEEEFDAYRKTQVQLIKSPFVLTAALRRPEISKLEAVRNKDDQVGWLQERIQVATPMDSEVVQIRMRGADPHDVQQIVNAVAHAYLSEVVNKDRGERLERHDKLAIKYKELLAELRTRRAEEKNLNEANGDIEVRRTEIQQLQATIDQMAALLTEAAIDIGLPVRVELIEEARVPSDAS